MFQKMSPVDKINPQKGDRMMSCTKDSDSKDSMALFNINCSYMLAKRDKTWIVYYLHIHLQALVLVLVLVRDTVRHTIVLSQLNAVSVNKHLLESVEHLVDFLVLEISLHGLEIDSVALRGQTGLGVGEGIGESHVLDQIAGGGSD